jgi:type I restriction enzyme M protein
MKSLISRISINQDTWLQGRAKLPTIGKGIDETMDAIENDNLPLKGVLPKLYAQEKIRKRQFGRTG